MGNRLWTALLVLGIGASMSAQGQTGATVVGSAPGVAGVGQTVKVTAKITAIDHAKREFTVKGPQGREVVLYAGPEVKNFAQMKVGDEITAEYVEALTLELKKGGGKTVGMTSQEGAKGAKAGERPAGAAGRQVTVIADVIGVDPATQTVTLRGPRRTVDLKVRDPAQFKLVAKGDQVEATYTEALAVSVQPTKAPAQK